MRGLQGSGVCCLSGSEHACTSVDLGGVYSSSFERKKGELVNLLLGLQMCVCVCVVWGGPYGSGPVDTLPVCLRGYKVRLLQIPNTMWRPGWLRQEVGGHTANCSTFL